jgi:hypothetical protein
VPSAECFDAARGTQHAALSHPTPNTLPTEEGFHWGELRDGTPYQWIGKDSPEALARADFHGGGPKRITLVACPLTLPEEAKLPMELYAGEALRGGRRCLYRAVLGEKGIRLGAESVVLRWLHGEAEVEVDRDCALYGRVSAEQYLRLAPGCRFERLYAPRIEFGGEGLATEAGAPKAWGRSPGEVTEEAGAMGGGVPALHVEATGARSDTRWLATGDLEIPPGSILRCDVVATGRLQIGAGTRIVGSVKSHLGLTIGEGVRVEGSVVSASGMHLKADCLVDGPVIAEREVVIETGCRLGAPEAPTTVTAPHIHVAPGVIAFGTVWAREGGRVLDEADREGDR